MNDGWIALQSIPLEGSTLTLKDHPLWLALLKEFTPCRITTTLEATVTVLPQEDGVLFQGNFTAEILLPCPRCTEDSTVRLAERFSAFEAFPEDPLEGHAPGARAGHGARNATSQAGSRSATHAPGRHEAAKAAARKNAPAQDPSEEVEVVDEAVIRLMPYGRGVEINPAALVWEEFSLAVPVLLLCKQSCKGLCPVCGCNKNTETCSCAQEQGDLRLAILRGLKVSDT